MGIGVTAKQLTVRVTTISEKARRFMWVLSFNFTSAMKSLQTTNWKKRTPRKWSPTVTIKNRVKLTRKRRRRKTKKSLERSPRRKKRLKPQKKRPKKKRKNQKKKQA